MDLTVTLSGRQDGALLELTGVLDYASVPHVRHVVFGLLDAGGRDIVLGVSGLRLLDAAAIKALLYLHRRAAQLDARLRLAEAIGTVRTALEVLGVANQLHADDELDWPVEQRERRPVALAELHVSHGGWPTQTTALLGRLQAMADDDPDRQEIRNAAIELCLPVARHLARRFGGGGEPLADLVQVAFLGTVKAVDNFDATLGVDFGSYATPTVIGEIKRYLRDKAWGIRLPRRLQELRVGAIAAHDELVQTLRRAPGVADLAAHLDVDQEEIIELIVAADICRPLSLDTPPGPTAAARDTGGRAALLDLLGGDDPGFDLVEFRESLRQLMWRLPERERRIVALRFYGNQTQAEIAAQVGLSQMHVSRLLHQSLHFLHRRLTEVPG
ncbi:SigB/SigF/SigG family RNA polymerase sigma factor [Dactylosporangium sp. NPDC049525]|uniref:SigB/SigF/SigG family RNA polymerase sigma factor n=1 Tax=Dactylosporangium sp. NPDC049525 TaxID=3154730 RepID=UPI003447EDCE